MNDSETYNFDRKKCWKKATNLPFKSILPHNRREVNKRLHLKSKKRDIIDNKDYREVHELDIANSTWGQKDYVFQTPFLDIMAVNYGAGLNIVDFSSNPDGCRLLINNWVSDETEARIKDLLHLINLKKHYAHLISFPFSFSHPGGQGMSTRRFQSLPGQR